VPLKDKSEPNANKMQGMEYAGSRRACVRNRNALMLNGASRLKISALFENKDAGSWICFKCQEENGIGAN
jgi:hypothetical protein